MREAIFNALFHRMARDPRVFLVVADVGINLVERIRDAYPDRFLNVGIAEANMIGVAAGLFNCGYRPVVYTISNFAVQRCFEQIRDDISLHDYPLVILGLGTGFDNCQLGPTHHIVDDWGTARNLPGLEIHCPSSVAYAGFVLDDVLDRGVAAYVRIPKGKGLSILFDAHWTYWSVMWDMKTLLISYGNNAQSCIETQQRGQNLSWLLFNMVRPLPCHDSLIRSLSKHERIVVVEDHIAETGLYSSICQLVAANRLNVEVVSRAPDRYYRECGDTPEHFWRKYRGDAKSLVEDFS